MSTIDSVLEKVRLSAGEGPVRFGDIKRLIACDPSTFLGEVDSEFRGVMNAILENPEFHVTDTQVHLVT